MGIKPFNNIKKIDKQNLKPILLIFSLLSTSLVSAASIETNKNLGLTQSFGTEKSDTEDKSINITTIKPHFGLIYSKSKLDINLDYSLILSSDNTEHENDISHQLNLNSTFTHIPNEWTTSYTSNILKKNISDTEQLVSNTATTSSASENYIVNSIKTSSSHNFNNNASLNSSLALTNQGFEDEASSKNASLSLGYNLNRILPSISLNTSLTSNKNLRSYDSDSSLNILSHYLINSHFKSFLSITSYTSDYDSLDGDKYSIGLNWTLNPTNYINFDIGKFGDKNTWSTDSLITIKRTTINLKHSEEVSTINQTLIDNLSSDISTFGDSTSDALSFVKNTSLILSHYNRRMTTSLSFSKVETYSDLEINPDRTNTNTSLSISYKLNKHNSINYSFSHDVIKSIINNQLDEHSVNWSSVLSKKSSYNVSLSQIEQDNEQVGFDSEITQLDFNYILIF